MLKLKNNMKFLVLIQSISDVITNSSSELFTISKGKCTTEEIKKFIYRIARKNLDSSKDFCSGMGGDINVYTVEEECKILSESEPVYKDFEKFLDFMSIEYAVEKEVFRNSLIIEIDRNREATIKYINSNFTVLARR